jgi:Tfp pilus assembly protein PilV
MHSVPAPGNTTWNRPRRAAGFTLIEALAAGMILSISSVLIGVGVSQALASSQRARNYQRAAELMHEVLTKIDIIGPDRVAREGPLDGSFDDRFRWEATIESRVAEGDLYDVTVRIIWDVPGGERSVKAHTMINDPLLSRSAVLEWDDL